MVLSTFLPLVAGRFGLAPTSTRHTNQSGIKLLPAEKSAGLVSNDPAGALDLDILIGWCCVCLLLCVPADAADTAAAGSIICTACRGVLARGRCTVTPCCCVSI